MHALRQHVCAGVRSIGRLHGTTILQQHSAIVPLRSVQCLASTRSINTQVDPAAVYTEVEDRVSPPEVIKAKAKQLAEVGPAGWQQQLTNQLVSIPVWLGTAANLVSKYGSRPSAITAAPDPSVFKLTPPFPIEEDFITVNGIKLHVVSPGRQPDKPLLLFVHGFPECWYSWRHQMQAFAEDYDVVALEMRGYGSSDKPQGVDSYRLDLLAADIKEAVAALGHTRCTLVAHDWGGTVAWAVAGLYGKSLVDKLIVMALPHLGIWLTNLTPEQKKKSIYMIMFQAPMLPEALLTADNGETMLDMFISEASGCRNKGVFTEADADWYRAAICQPGAATAALNYYRWLVPFLASSDPQHPIWRAIRRPLDMPVLVLYGDQDVALGVELLDGIEAAVPQVTVKLLKNCSHWVPQDYPQQVNELVRSWLVQQQR